MLKLWGLGLLGSLLLGVGLFVQTTQFNQMMAWLGDRHAQAGQVNALPSRDQVARQFARVESGESLYSEKSVPERSPEISSESQNNVPLKPGTLKTTGAGPARKASYQVPRKTEYKAPANTEQSDRVALNKSDKPLSSKASRAGKSTLTPLLTEYEKGLEISFVPPQVSRQQIKRALVRVMLSPTRPREASLLSATSIDVAQTPYFYRRIVNQNDEPVRYPAQAYDYADFLMKNRRFTDQRTGVVSIEIPLESMQFAGHAARYESLVKRHASAFGVDAALIYAVMEVESHFNPLAVSSSNAIGLMQLKPEAAGRDVFEYIDAKTGQPSLHELFDSDNNIRMGTAYLWMLREVYLKQVAHPESRKMLVIASYNGGIQTVMDLFGETRAKAIKRMNQLSPQNIYRILRYQHQSAETRRYLDKVLQAQNRYQALLSSDGRLNVG